MPSVYRSVYDIVFNLGIKCNTLSMSREAGIRYFSSPFDNIDTVEGIRQVADLLENKFDGYFDDILEWEIDNHMNRQTGEVNTKLIWHKDTPKVYYPHFNERWLSGNGMDAIELAAWKQNPELNLKPIFGDLKKMFIKRQQRLVSLLDQDLNFLFLRVDERRNVDNRIVNNNSQEDIEYFVRICNKAYKANIKVLYLYCDSEKNPRIFNDTEDLFFVKIPESDADSERQFVVEYLKKLSVKPRESLLELGFTDSH